MTLPHTLDKPAAISDLLKADDVLLEPEPNGQHKAIANGYDQTPEKASDPPICPLSADLDSGLRVYFFGVQAYISLSFCIPFDSGIHASCKSSHL